MDDDLKRYLDAIEERNASAHAETRQHFDQSTADIKQHFDQSTAEIRQDFNRSTAEIRQDFSRSTETLRLHFDITTEATRRDFQLLAELVAHLDGKIDANNASIASTAAETQAMVKFSHTELHSRVSILEASHHALEERHRTLEGDVTELRARVVHLESSPH